MDSPRIHPVARLLPSFTDVAFLMPLVFMFTRLDGVTGMLGDGDTGWHVRAGDWMLANGRVPTQDIFSFTMPDQPWYAWEWLWDVIFAWLHQSFGMGAVVLASVAVICLTFGLLFRLAYKQSQHALIAIGLTLLAAAASTIHWLARPHLFTMLFIVVFLALIGKAREGNWKLLLTLPVLTILWTNLHGGFLVGIALLGLYGLGELAVSITAASGENRKTPLRASIWLIGTAALCALASLVNPYGYQLHVHIWHYLRDPGMTSAIVEFQGTNFRDGASGYLEALLALGLCAALWHGRRRQFAEVFLLLAWGHWALLVARNIPLYAIVSVPLIAPAMASWLRSATQVHAASWIRGIANTLEEFGQEIHSLERIPRLHWLGPVALAACGWMMLQPAPPKLFRPEYDAKSYPAAVLSQLNASQRVFTNDEWGDYLIYKLWPSGVKVYADGRSDFYGSKFNREFMAVLNGRYDWEQTLARYGVDTVLLAPEGGLASTLKESHNWRVVYDDGRFILFRQNAFPTNAPGSSSGTISASGNGGAEARRLATSPGVIPEDHGTAIQLSPKHFSTKQGANPL